MRTTHYFADIRTHESSKNRRGWGEIDLSTVEGRGKWKHPFGPVGAAKPSHPDAVLTARVLFPPTRMEVERRASSIDWSDSRMRAWEDLVAHIMTLKDGRIVALSVLYEAPIRDKDKALWESDADSFYVAHDAMFRATAAVRHAVVLDQPPEGLSGATDEIQLSDMDTALLAADALVRRHDQFARVEKWSLSVVPTRADRLLASPFVSNMAKLRIRHALGQGRSA